MGDYPQIIDDRELPATERAATFLTDMKNRLQFQFSIAGLVLLVSAGVLAPNPRANSNAPKIYPDKIDPHWFAGNSKFWYRLEHANHSRQFVLVDAVTGRTPPAGSTPTTC